MTKRTRKNFTKDERKDMIILQFNVAIQNGRQRWQTVHEIANKIGMSACPSLRAIIDEMTTDGELQRIPVDRPGRFGAWEYMLAEGTFKEPQQQQPIVIRHRGKLMTLLEAVRQ